MAASMGTLSREWSKRCLVACLARSCVASGLSVCWNGDDDEEDEELVGDTRIMDAGLMD